ncbi:MAG: MCE family protein [Actinophytocola sp.]|nr:MCE family protein [Actinophytocola sp.]
MSARGAVSTLKRRLLGVGFIVLVIAGVALSVAGFNNTFTPYVTVSLKTDKVGNQLGHKSDVKVRGLIIGHVNKITPTSEGAELELKLNPEDAKLVPASASARLLPKTLFGERYVSLEFDDASGPSLSNGDVIPEDRTETATELSASFEKLLPVLRAVQPQKLNSTLSAMSTALDGRGEELGKTLSELGDYMGKLNPHLPQLKEQFKQLAKFSNNFSEVTPDIVRTLDNFRTSARTLVEKRQQLSSVYSSVTTASRDLESYLAANKNNFIRVGKLSQPTLDLVAKYSPSFPCVTRQMADALPTLNKAFGKGTDKPGLQAKVYITPNRGEYKPGQDEPKYNFMGEGGYRGPWCIDPHHPEIPRPFPYPYRFLYLDDGSRRPPDARSELDGEGLPCDAINTFGNPVPQAWLRECAPGTAPGGRGSSSTGGSAPMGAPSANPANTPEEGALIAELLSVQTGAHPSDIPGWGGLLVGPLYRGMEVSFE